MVQDRAIFTMANQ